ncbi:rootletin [Hyalella azteca]|uniref:Rootletin n=1 Tax=Hyalella azteca TaxID=294128 RepID=A0A979FWF5_HYAAZ|nr:rootletin [Hyalella azteca]
MAESAEHILLQCLSILTGRTVDRTTQLIDDAVFTLVVSKLKLQIDGGQSLKAAAPALKNLIKEHFLDDLIDFDEAASGNSNELVKLLLLLLYVAFITDRDVMLLLSDALPCHLQLKVKYLFECVQKRGSGLSKKYLSVLAAETLAGKSSAGQEVRWSLGSPRVYSSSPKASSLQSPLKELVQSPDFVVQRKLEQRVREVKRLSKELNVLENEKQDWLLEQEISKKKTAQLVREVQKVRQLLADVTKEKENAESLALSGADQIHEQAQRLGRELSLAHKENSSLQKALNDLQDAHDQLLTKEQLTSGLLDKARAERQSLAAELLMLLEQHQVTAAAIDERDVLLRERAQLEEQLQELCHKPYDRTIEPEDCVASPASRTCEMSSSSPPASPAGENMGEAVVDLMLQEAKEELTQARTQLQHTSQELTQAQTCLQEWKSKQLQTNEELVQTQGQLQTTREQLDAMEKTHADLVNKHASVLQKHEHDQLQWQAQSESLLASQESLKAELEEQSRYHSAVQELLSKEVQQLQCQLMEAAAVSATDAGPATVPPSHVCHADGSTLNKTVERVKAELETQIVSMQAQFTLMKDAVTHLKENLDHAATAIQRKDHDLSMAHSRAEKAECQLADIQREMTEARAAAETEILKLQSELTEARASGEAQQRCITEAEHQTQQLQQQIKEVLRSMSGKEETARVAEARLKEKMGVLEACRARHEQKLLEAQTLIESGAAENSGLLQKMNQALQLQKQLQNDLDVMQKQHVEEIKSKEDLLRELGECKSQWDDEKQRLQARTEDLTTQLSVVTQNVETLSSQLRDLEKKRHAELLVSQQKENEAQECRNLLLDEHKSALEKLNVEKEELNVALQSSREEVHRLSSSVSCKDELLLQAHAESSRYAVKCEELQKTIESLKIDNSKAVECYEFKIEELVKEVSCLKSDKAAATELHKVQSQELEFINNDLKDVKQTCASLEEALNNDKATHMEALRDKDEKHKREILKINTQHQEELKNLESSWESRVAEKTELLTHLQAQHSKLFEEHQGQEEANRVRVSELLSNVTNLQLEKKAAEEQHTASLSSISADCEKTRAHCKVLECRIQEITLAQEMLKIELSQQNRKHEEVASQLKLQVQNLEDNNTKYELEVKQRNCELEESSRLLEEVRADLKTKEKACQDLETQIKTLKEERSEEVCSLEDQITHLNNQIEKLNEEFDSKAKQHQSQVLALSEENMKTVHEIKDTYEREIGLINDLITPNKVGKSTILDKGASGADRLQALRDDVAEIITDKTLLEQQLAALLKEKSLEKDLTDKLSFEKSRELSDLQETFQAKISEAELAVKLLEDKLREKTAEIDSASETLCNKEKQLIECKEEHSRNILQLKADHEKRVNEITAELKMDVTNLSRQLELTSIHEREKAASESLQFVTDLKAKINSCEQRCQALEAEKRSLEQALRESASVKSDLEIRILELEEQLKTWKKRLIDKDQTVSDALKKQVELQQQVENEKQRALASQAEVTQARNQVQELVLENASLLSFRQQKEKEMSAGEAELLQLQDRLVQLQNKLQRTEAALIDKEKDVAEAKEDVLRVQRESELSTRSLQEEMSALKLKYKADKQAYSDKMKNIFKDQIEKLMAEVQKYKSISDDNSLLAHKYEAAKNKLAKAYADLNDATRAKDDYLRQTTQLTEHTKSLRESLEHEQKLRQEAESAVEELRATVTQLQQAESAVEGLKAKVTQQQQMLKTITAERRTLRAKLSTADSQLRLMDRNWNRESLGGKQDAGSIRNALSESTLCSPRPCAAAVSRAAPGDARPTTTQKQAGGNTERQRSAAFTASYRKAVGRTTRSSRASSSADDDLLDGSDVPLLSESRSDQHLESSGLVEGLFRKPSIRIHGPEVRGKTRAPVELRSLICNAGEDDHSGGDAPQAWQEGEKRLQEEQQRKAGEAERKKLLARQKDGRRMTVDGRILPDGDGRRQSLSLDRASGRSVPRGLGSFFNCEDEDQEFFSNKYLHEMKVGLCEVDDDHDPRLSELQRRNSLYPPHMRCSYAAELQYNPHQDKVDPIACASLMTKKELGVEDLESATERLVIESPAFNLRKRTLSDSFTSSSSLDISFGKKVRRLSTSYSRPGPPTPGRKSIGRADKENRRISLRSQGASPSSRSLGSCSSSSALPHAPVSRRVSQSPSLSVIQPTPAKLVHAKPASPTARSMSGGSSSSPDKEVTVSSRGRATPAARRSHLPHTPASIKRLIRGKSPWKKLTDASETPKADAKLKIFRRPFGSKNYNVLSASQREREGPDAAAVQPSQATSSKGPQTSGNRARRHNNTCV